MDQTGHGHAHLGQAHVAIKANDTLHCSFNSLVDILEIKFSYYYWGTPRIYPDDAPHSISPSTHFRTPSPEPGSSFHSLSHTTPPNHPDSLHSVGHDSTPATGKESTNAPYAITAPKMENRYKTISDETAGAYRVGISPADFFESFMPWNEKTSDHYKNARPPVELINKLKAMGSSKENEMYMAYYDALNDWVKGRAQCDEQQSHVITTILGKRRDPDHYTGPAKAAADMGHYAESENPTGNTTDFSLMQTQVEFKTLATSDPFIDPGSKSEPPTHQKPTMKGDQVKDEEPANKGPSYPCEKSTLNALQVKGQMASYAAITLYLSFRTHLFTLGIFGKYCRFIRWDRRGAIVTRLINYTEEPETIFHFYHRFAQLTRDQRGFDPTVTRIDPNSPDANSDDVRDARKEFSKYSKAMLHCEARADTPANPIIPPNPTLFRMTVVFDGVERSFILPAPHFHFGCLSPFSKSTRRCLVYNLDADKNDQPKILFMKDYWRKDSDYVTPEAAVYKLLAEKGVREHVTEMDIGGDIPGLRTRWQEARFGDFSSFPNPEYTIFAALQGHRIFLTTVAMDLTAFETARTLITCVADAMEGVLNAFIKANVLHRDISVGNIMIIMRELDPPEPDSEGHQAKTVMKSERRTEKRGIIIDWDNCFVLRDTKSAPRARRTGTWQFISARLLMGTSTVHTILDDQESAYWVLLYVALRYLRHNLSGEQLHQWLTYMFDESAEDAAGHLAGGLHKYDHLTHPNRSLSRRFDIAELVSMFDELADGFSVLYQQPPSEEDQCFTDINWVKTKLRFTVDEIQRLARVVRYNTVKETLKNRGWFIETLRKHARLMPLPSSEKAYDYHCNYISYGQFASGSQQYDRHYQSKLITSRIHGMTGQLGTTPVSSYSLKRNPDDTAENDQKKRSRLSEFQNEAKET